MLNNTGRLSPAVLKKENSMIQKRTIGIIGAGNVGMAAAYAVFMKQVAGEVILIDRDERRAEGEAMDMMHGQPYAGPVRVRHGSYKDLAAAQIVVICAGVGQKPGESRLDLLNRNVDVLGQIAYELDRHSPEAVLIVATNPVDILTYALQRLSRRPNHRIIGTGTMLDSGRFRSLLGRHYGVDPRSVHAYIIGEHGDSEVPLWSSAAIGGVSIVDNAVLGRRFDTASMDHLLAQVRDAAYNIIDRKGYTNTAIGTVIARLIEALLEDQKSIFTLSTRLDGEYGLSDLCLSIPCVTGLDGIESKILPILDDCEAKALQASALVLGDSIGGLNLPSMR
jgi:L-lactate dehydrogenase